MLVVLIVQADISLCSNVFDKDRKKDQSLSSCPPGMQRCGGAGVAYRLAAHLITFCINSVAACEGRKITFDKIYT